ncbi:MAG TPA: hypothetical protein VLA85_01050, partial [Verrucomicrobiae bacterium]|nr:hypothetical protein [Verrucomicrobiae bacterium]
MAEPVAKAWQNRNCARLRPLIPCAEMDWHWGSDFIFIKGGSRMAQYPLLWIERRNYPSFKQIE